jgi:hypothetical protein
VPGENEGECYTKAVDFFLFLRRRVSESVESGHFLGKIGSFASCDLSAGCDLRMLEPSTLHHPDCGELTALEVPSASRALADASDREFVFRQNDASGIEQD